MGFSKEDGVQNRVVMRRGWNKRKRTSNANGMKGVCLMKDDEMVKQSSHGLTNFEELRRLSPKVTGGLVRMREEAYRGKTVPAKYKLLTAMSISIAIRCEPCIHAYVRMACDQGISREEFIEFLEVAMTMQGCPGEEWALKAYEAYKGYVIGQQAVDGAGCCRH